MVSDEAENSDLKYLRFPYESSDECLNDVILIIE